jgi:hypothetical protein
MSDSVKLRITETGGALWDESDGYFSIVETPASVQKPYYGDFSIPGKSGFQCGSLDNFEELIIYDSKGAVILRKDLNSGALNRNMLSDYGNKLDNGVYFISFKESHKGKTFNTILIKR